MSGDHLSPEEYQARAQASMEENIRQGMSPEGAWAEYEANMHAETYADRYQASAEAEWQAAADAMEASGLTQAEAERDAAWSSGDAARIEAAEAAFTQAGARFEQAFAGAWELARDDPDAGREAEMS